MTQTVFTFLRPRACRRWRCAAAATLSTVAGCGALPEGFDLTALAPIDLSGNWRIIPDDPDRPSNCIRIRNDTVAFYTTRCDTTNDLVTVNEIRAVNSSTVFIDLDVRDSSGGVGRVEILATVVDADTLEGQVRISNTDFTQFEVLDMTMIR